jgi:hypothetical protein
MLKNIAKTIWKNSMTKTRLEGLGNFFHILGHALRHMENILKISGVWEIF